HGLSPVAGAGRPRRLHPLPTLPILQSPLTTHKAPSCHPSGYVPGSCTCRCVNSSSWEPPAPYPPADATTTPTSCVGTPTASCSTPEKAPNDRCTWPARQPPTSPASASPTSTETTAWACPAPSNASPVTKSPTRYESPTPPRVRSTGNGYATPPPSTTPR